MDAEVRALALALDDGRELPELTASGLVATCTACGSLMGSGDRFCPRCGAAAGAVLPASENGSEPPELEATGEEADAAEDAGDELPPAEDEGGAIEERQATAVETGSPLVPGDGGGALGNGSPPGEQDDLVRLARSKMRAGRRAARRWLADRRPQAR